MANAIYVYGTDIYTAGFEGRDLAGKAIVWKNGEVLYRLTDGIHAGNAESISILGNDIYVAGETVSNTSQINALTWKNGKVLYEMENVNELSIYIAGNDIYTLGYEYDEDYKRETPTVWKNGEFLYAIDKSYRDVSVSNIFVVNK